MRCDTNSLFIILQVHSTCFGCQPHPSSGVQKTLTTVSATVQLPPSNVATLEGGSCTKNMTRTGACSYSFMRFWWWVWLTPETCRVNFDVLLTVHLSIFISVIDQLDTQKFCFTISLFLASTCFEHMCSSSGGQNCITQALVSSHWNKWVVWNY